MGEQMQRRPNLMIMTIFGEMLFVDLANMQEYKVMDVDKCQ